MRNERKKSDQCSESGLPHAIWIAIALFWTEEERARLQRVSKWFKKAIIQAEKIEINKLLPTILTLQLSEQLVSHTSRTNRLRLPLMIERFNQSYKQTAPWYAISELEGLFDKMEPSTLKRIQKIIKPIIRTNQGPMWWAQFFLFLAASYGHIQFAKALLEREDVDINSTLIIAAEKGRTEDVAALLERDNIDVNAANRFGNTALIIAALMGRTEVVSALLAHPRIDVNAKNTKGYTALKLAKMRGHTDIAAALRARANSHHNAELKNSHRNEELKNSDRYSSCIIM